MAVPLPLTHMRRTLLVSYPPSSVTQGSITAAFPLAAFTSWCNSNTQCSAAGKLGLSLTTISTASVTVANLLFGSSGASGGYFRFVSALVDFQLVNLTVTNQAICSTSSPCWANITFPVTTSDTSIPLLCLRFEPTSATLSVPLSLNVVGGYPDGTNGTRRASILVQNTIACSTTNWGKVAVAQYLAAPPPPPPPVPPAPPPPPPQANATGVAAPPQGTASVSFTATFSLDFDQLSANATLLSAFKQDISYWAAVHLADSIPSLMQSTATGLPYYDRVVITLISRGSVVVQFQVGLPQGSSDAQVQQLATLIGLDSAVSLFGGSAYVGQIQPPFTVTSVVYESGAQGFWTGAHIGLIVGCVGGVALVAAGAVAFVLWRRKAQAILPPNPDEPLKDGAGRDAGGKLRKEKKAKKKTVAVEEEQEEEGFPGSKAGPAVGQGGGGSATPLMPAASDGPPMGPSGPWAGAYSPQVQQQYAAYGQQQPQYGGGGMTMPPQVPQQYAPYGQQQPQYGGMPQQQYGMPQQQYSQPMPMGQSYGPYQGGPMMGPHQATMMGGQMPMPSPYSGGPTFAPQYSSPVYPFQSGPAMGPGMAGPGR